MANIEFLALNALQFYQRAIQTSGHNIANSANPNFSRQMVSVATLPPERLGNNYFGLGGTISSVDRLVDDYLTKTIFANESEVGRASSFVNLASTLEKSVANSETSIAASLQSTFSALQEVVESPDYTPSRSALMSELNVLVGRMQTTDAEFMKIHNRINQQLELMAKEINTIASSIASVNAQLLEDDIAPPDLLDRRDALVKDLAQYMDITVIERESGAVDISIGQGDSLVLGATTLTLSAARSRTDATNFDMSINNNGVLNVINNSIEGGQLGGMIQFREKILMPARSMVGLIALGLSEQMNTQHQLGMDAQDNLGKLMFKDYNSTAAMQNRVLVNSQNGGTAQFSINIDDTNQLVNSEYKMIVTAGPNYSVIRQSDGQTTTFAGMPQTIDGFTISLDSGAVSVGDTFILAPTRLGAQALELNISQADEIASASPIRTLTSTNNIGAGRISKGEVVDVTTADFTTTPKALTPPIRVEFLSATTYQLVNVTTSAVIEGPIAFTPGSSNAVFPTPGTYDPGYRVDLEGVPSTGDTFTIEYNSGGKADNRNILKLAETQTNLKLLNGTATLQDGYANLVADIGIQTAQGKVNLDAANVLQQDTLAQREVKSGVNLTEEGVNLLRYQQAYQAASQLISVSQRLYDSLFSVLR